MKLRNLILAVLILCTTSSLRAQSDPATVLWLSEDLSFNIKGHVGIDFAFRYQVHLEGGADPEGDATLTLERCINHVCTTGSLPIVEGVSFTRFGIDPSQYHNGRNLYTLTLTLTDNGMTLVDTLTIRVFALPANGGQQP